MIVHLSLKEKVETCDADCDCHICQASRSLDTENCADVVNLLTKGRSETLILDSCSASDKGFHVKLRNLETRRCDVAEGPNFTIAIARAATKALTP